MHKYCLLLATIVFFGFGSVSFAQNIGQLDVDRKFDLDRSEVDYKIIIKNNSSDELIRGFSIIIPHKNYQLISSRGAKFQKEVNTNDLKISFGEDVLRPGFSREIGFLVHIPNLVEEKGGLYTLEISNFSSNMPIGQVHTRINYSTTDFPPFVYSSRNIEENPGTILFLENKAICVSWGEEYYANFLLKISNISDQTALIPILSDLPGQEVEYLNSPSDEQLLFDKDSNAYLLSTQDNLSLKGSLRLTPVTNKQISNALIKKNYEFPVIEGDTNHEKVKSVSEYLEKNFNIEMFQSLDKRFNTINDHDLAINLYTYYWLNSLDIKAQLVFGKNIQDSSSSYWILWQDGDTTKALDPILYFSDQLDVVDWVPPDRVILFSLVEDGNELLDEFIELSSKDFYWYFGFENTVIDDNNETANIHVIFPEQYRFELDTIANINIQNVTNKLLEIKNISSRGQNLIPEAKFHQGLLPYQYKVLKVTQPRGLLGIFNKKSKMEIDVIYRLGNLEETNTFSNDIVFANPEISRRFVLLDIFISVIVFVVIIISKKILSIW